MRLDTTNWERVFQEDDDFNEDSDVLNYLAGNEDMTFPFQQADLTHFQVNTSLDCLISTKELTDVLRSSKATCPGSSRINKTILAKLPAPAIRRRRDIYNDVLSARYLPDLLKEAEMQMVVKLGKVPTRPDNYLLISLLEVPGRMLEKVINGRLANHLEREE